MNTDAKEYDARRAAMEAALKRTAAERRKAEAGLKRLGPLVTVNDDQRLYVIREAWPGKHTTCLGFEVCEGRIARLVAWLGPKHALVKQWAPGTLERYQQYTALMAWAERRCRDNKERCPCELTPELVGLEGRRVEVVTCIGTVERFIVGKSAGWMPVHLQLPRRDSTGGMAVYGAPFRSLQVLEK